ncbi:MAG: GIY-YIG nuclease family protein [Verrucomicrobiales bacterium]|nr:GIY-YIG nuclease family protein [Verrucomicrobiales bacterium]
MSSERKGWIYVVTNPSIPGKIKIGFTESAVEARLDDLFGTGLPTPFKKEYEILLKGAREVELQTHTLLKEQRVSKQREFFECSPKEAVMAIHKAAKELDREILHEESYFSIFQFVYVCSRGQYPGYVQIGFVEDQNDLINDNEILFKDFSDLEKSFLHARNSRLWTDGELHKLYEVSCHYAAAISGINAEEVSKKARSILVSKAKEPFPSIHCSPEEAVAAIHKAATALGVEIHSDQYDVAAHTYPDEDIINDAINEKNWEKVSRLLECTGYERKAIQNAVNIHSLRREKDTNIPEDCHCDPYIYLTPNYHRITGWIVQLLDAEFSEGIFSLRDHFMLPSDYPASIPDNLKLLDFNAIVLSQVKNGLKDGKQIWWERDYAFKKAGEAFFKKGICDITKSKLFNNAQELVFEYDTNGKQIVWRDGVPYELDDYDAAEAIALWSDLPAFANEMGDGFEDWLLRRGVHESRLFM